MWMKSTRTRLVRFCDWLRGAYERPAEPEEDFDSERLVHRFDVTVDATCPCGSQILHHLSLMDTADCPRCNRSFGIKAIAYHCAPTGLPDPVITIGWVRSTRKMRTRRGVH